MTTSWNLWRTGLLVLATFYPSAQSRADIFQYHPLATLRLGGTFDPYDLSRPRPNCLAESEEIAADGLNGQVTTPDMKFVIRQITDRRELNSLLSQSISISGHYEMFSGDGSFSQQDEIHSTSDSIAWVLAVTARYGKFRLKNPKLNDEARALAERDLEQLLTRCGASVVLQITRGISAAVIINIQTATRTEKQTTQANLSAKAGGELWGASANAGLNAELQTALNQGDASIDVQVSGGPGAPGLASLITSLKGSTSIDEMKKVLASYVQQMGPQASVPLEYETSQLSDFVPTMALPDFETYQELIGEYYLALQQNHFIIAG